MSPHPRFCAIAGDLVFTEVRFLLLLQLQSQFSHWDTLPRPCGCGIQRQHDGHDAQVQWPGENQHKRVFMTWLSILISLFMLDQSWSLENYKTNSWGRESLNSTSTGIINHGSNSIARSEAGQFDRLTWQNHKLQSPNVLWMEEILHLGW